MLLALLHRRPTDYKRWLEAARPYAIQYEEGYEPYVIIARQLVPWYDERFVGYRKNKVGGPAGSCWVEEESREGRGQGRVRIAWCWWRAACCMALHAPPACPPGQPSSCAPPPRLLPLSPPQVVHLLYLSTGGINWVVHPRAFTVHSPHPRARTWKVTHKTGLWDQVRAEGRGAGEEVERLAGWERCLRPWPLVGHARSAAMRSGGRNTPAAAAAPPLTTQTPAPTLPLPQLADLYAQCMAGMQAGTYVPASMYSCGEHTAGPHMGRLRGRLVEATAA